MRIQTLCLVRFTAFREISKFSKSTLIWRKIKYTYIRYINVMKLNQLLSNVEKIIVFKFSCKYGVDLKNVFLMLKRIQYHSMEQTELFSSSEVAARFRWVNNNDICTKKVEKEKKNNKRQFISPYLVNSTNPFLSAYIIYSESFIFTWTAVVQRNVQASTSVIFPRSSARANHTSRANLLRFEDPVNRAIDWTGTMPEHIYSN